MVVDEIAPIVTMWLPTGNMREVADRDEVAALFWFLHEVEGIEDLETTPSISPGRTWCTPPERRTLVRHSRRGVWENGPNSNADLVIAGRYTNTPILSNHSQNVHGIVRNSEAGAPHGHAPGCSLYSANSKVRGALIWAVKDENCTVVNQSFHRASEPHSDILSSDDVYGDWLALHWPYPLIVHAAGNFWNGDDDNVIPPRDEYVNHKGYNTLAVGNHNDDADAMRASSVFRNPTSSHGDRELPEISANGIEVTTTGLTYSGTSQASPAVAGIAALLQGTDSGLVHWPEGCRAILLASTTRNVRDGTWWQDVLAGTDTWDGSGAVNAAEAHRVAQNRRWRDAEGTRRGWDTGLLTSDDFDGDGLSTFEYQVAVPDSLHGPRNVKVALAYTSKMTAIFGVPFVSQLGVDLDIKIYDSDGTRVGYSGSWDNSYEIAEFVGERGQTYTIKIRRWVGSESTWYGFAWTVTGGLAWPGPFDEMVLQRVLRQMN